MNVRKCAAVLLCVLIQCTLSTVCARQENPEKQKPAIDWQKGPLKASLNGVAEVTVPEGFLFTDRKGAQKLLELTENIPNGKEVGAIVPEQKGTDDGVWFVIFEFHEVGFVKDDEKEKIDAGAILKSIQEGTEENNESRKEKGWPEFHVVGWEKPPYYDQRTNNLTWAIQGRDDRGGSSVNHSIRILGRRGTMNVDLVLAPKEYASVLPAFNSLIGTFQFQQGSRYADFVKGDKVAEYGLTALIAGGAGALAVKTGFLMKMWKFILMLILALKKALIVIVVGIGAAIKKLWNKIFGRSEEVPHTDSSDTPSMPSNDQEEAEKPTEIEVGPKIE